MAARVHCNFTCGLQIDSILSSSGEKNFVCTATMQGPPTAVTIDRLQKRDTMTVTIRYYNIFNDIFLENAMIFCIGSLSVHNQESSDSSLEVRSHCLIRLQSIQIFQYNISLLLTFLLQCTWRPLTRLLP